MFIVISQSNPDPLYKQVSDQIKKLIINNDLKSNDKLPSVRELSKQLKISTITVKRSYSDLEQEGFIITRPGLGTFVSSINEEEIFIKKRKEIKSDLNKIIKNAKNFGISKNEIFEIIEEIEEE